VKSAAFSEWVHLFQNGPHGILAVSETELLAPNAIVVRVPSVHTFIMNSALVARDIVATSRSL
jgi:hypothetical protein